MARRKTAAVVNSAFVEQLDNPATSKLAADEMSNITRMVMREESAVRKVLPFEECADDELDVQLGTDRPVKIEWKEPLSHGALSVPFAGAPHQFVIRGPNYPIYFAEIVGPKYIKHLNELRVYPFDIRQVLTDHSIRDVHEEEDTRWFRDTVDVAVGSANTASDYTGKVQFRTFDGGWSRNNLVDAMTILPASTAKIKADKAVVNAVTVYQWMKWGFEEMGGDFSQSLLRDGSTAGSWLAGEFMQTKWIVTIKYDLVADGVIYFFGVPEFMGHAYYLHEIVMFTDKVGQLITFYPSETIGAGLGNVASVGKAQMNQL